MIMLETKREKSSSSAGYVKDIALHLNTKINLREGAIHITTLPLQYVRFPCY